ncbi:hypothetical protein MNV_20008 [Candidatus Methanoperedens nitroreducens]|uniref:Uncharacterized protein n=1 Tax=Candidatus Methanoperedens nitratireducens TaxID=1392998 RepID=A0A284VN06_9EURY|nr:hypothetical protein MNV_20008 [Candidatus Methanoperedens nitroreducens]
MTGILIKINEEKIIEVWGISKAIENFEI